MESIEKWVLEGFCDEFGELFQDVVLVKSVWVVQGDLLQMIFDEVEKLVVDLIVVGSYSYGIQFDMLLGWIVVCLV